MSLPLIIGGVCILTFDHRHLFRPSRQQQSIMGALYKGFWDPRSSRSRPSIM
jgi:hypothetical protein